MKTDNSKNPDFIKKLDGLTKSTNNNVPIIYAVMRYGTKLAIKVIEEKGANVNTVNEKDGNTPLHIAIFRNKIEVILALIKAGAFVNAVNKEGDTPLHRTIASNNHELVRLLVKSGADLTKENKKGETPMTMLESRANNRELENNNRELENNNREQNNNRELENINRELEKYDTVIAANRFSNIDAMDQTPKEGQTPEGMQVIISSKEIYTGIQDDFKSIITDTSNEEQYDNLQNLSIATFNNNFDDLSSTSESIESSKINNSDKDLYLDIPDDFQSKSIGSFYDDLSFTYENIEGSKINNFKRKQSDKKPATMEATSNTKKRKISA